MDWSPTADLIVYSAQGSGGEDLFRTDPVRPTADNQQQTRNLTCPGADGTTPACDRSIRERRPRIDSDRQRRRATSASRRTARARSGSSEPEHAAPGDDRRAGIRAPHGTPYVVGSDADPDFSPDRASLVFRRLTATGNGGARHLGHPGGRTSTAPTCERSSRGPPSAALPTGGPTADRVRRRSTRHGRAEPGAHQRRRLRAQHDPVARSRLPARLPALAGAVVTPGGTGPYTRASFGLSPSGSAATSRCGRTPAAGALRGGGAPTRVPRSCGRARSSGDRSVDRARKAVRRPHAAPR